MTTDIAVIGAGLIGRSWAIVFARAGFTVSLYDTDARALERATAAIEHALTDLQTAGLAASSADITARISVEATLSRATEGVLYVQECGPETVEAKQALFAELERIAPAEAILASSSSGIMASQFTAHLHTAHRCLVAHPVNPPYLVPLVELSPGPSTSEQTMKTARELLESAGQVPVSLKAEIPGFVLNRLQGALLNEALRLVQGGFVNSGDLDKTVKHGLGLRWALMGPFETIDLNAPGGVLDYGVRYGPLYERVAKDSHPPDWSGAGLDRIARERRAVLPADELDDRQRWRDKRLMHLVAHLERAPRDDNESRH
ncbi:MAG: 3-hydroxyacyl-CoA dehydrogenase [Salinisphaera sp.]|jgi:L-gulonate 3-dehydrogenase|nr:3-hydroxyacyl-CoA dehydrogenase [Salinisphaera sp.]